MRGRHVQRQPEPVRNLLAPQLRAVFFVVLVPALAAAALTLVPRHGRTHLQDISDRIGGELDPLAARCRGRPTDTIRPLLAATARRALYTSLGEPGPSATAAAISEAALGPTACGPRAGEPPLGQLTTAAIAALPRRGRGRDRSTGLAAATGRGVIWPVLLVLRRGANGSADSRREPRPGPTRVPSQAGVRPGSLRAGFQSRAHDDWVPVLAVGLADQPRCRHPRRRHGWTEARTSHSVARWCFRW